MSFVAAFWLKAILDYYTKNIVFNIIEKGDSMTTHEVEEMMGI